MTAPPAKQVTVSFSIPAIVHLSVGSAVFIVCVIAFWIHFALPRTHEYKETASDIGNLAGCAVLAYWLWCSYQRGRTETGDLTDVATQAVTEAREREERILGAMREVSSKIAENRDAIKDVAGAVAESATRITAALTETRSAGEDRQAVDLAELKDAIREVVDAIEALQDCYLEEGTALILPGDDEQAQEDEEDRRDLALL
jgi:hypothetical protein